MKLGLDCARAKVSRRSTARCWRCACPAITSTQAAVAADRNRFAAADNAIRLLAARNDTTLSGQTRSTSASLGVSIDLATLGVAATASASAARGRSQGTDTVWSNTQVSAGDTASLASGGDTTLRGAVVEGRRIEAGVGGNLAIESLQDTSRYRSRNTSAGVTLSVPLSGGSLGGSVSAGQSRIESDYASVTGQSALRAGEGGFGVTVAGDTTLTGGAITSSQAAVDADRNRFATGGSLTLIDLHNRADYTASAASVSIGAGLSLDGRLAPQGTGAGLGRDAGSAQSTTLAAISGIAGNTAARTGNAGSGLKPIFDREKVQKEIEAQAAITQVFGQLAPQAWGRYANTQFAEALEAGDEEGMRCWGPDGVCRAGGHAVLGGLAGGVGGAVGAGLSSVAAPHVQSFLIEQGLPPSAASAVTQLAAIGAGSAVGGTAGATGAFNEASNNAVAAIPLIVEGIVAGGAIAARACLSSSACLNALRLGGTALVAKVASLLSQDELAQIPGFGAGTQPPQIGPLVTPMPDPKEVQRLHGAPPLQNLEELRSWLANVLEGYPADEAEKWAKGLITTLPAEQQATWRDFILQAVQDNAIAGSRREREVTADLQALYPSGSVQNQQYLRDRDGNIVIDPNTGTARRLDHVVVVGGKIMDVVETTSLTANKRDQILHEQETRNAGGVYIRDRNTGSLIEVPSISRIERRL
jgi:hypothetical protein